MNRTWTVIIVIVAIGLIWYAASRPKNDSTTPTSTTSETSTATPSPSAAIFIYQDGFTPTTATIKAGDLITIVNNSTQAIQINSDPHPTHTDNPTLNVGAIEPGKSTTVTISTAGTWGFHNHLDPTKTARVIAE